MNEDSVDVNAAPEPAEAREPAEKLLNDVDVHVAQQDTSKDEKPAESNVGKTMIRARK